MPQSIRPSPLRRRFLGGCESEESMVAGGTFEKNLLSGKLGRCGIVRQHLKSGRSDKPTFLEKDRFVVWGGMWHRYTWSGDETKGFDLNSSAIQSCRLDEIRRMIFRFTIPRSQGDMRGSSAKGMFLFGKIRKVPMGPLSTRSVWTVTN